MNQLKFQGILDLTRQLRHETKRDWFSEALKALNIDEVSGWPDRFGKALRSWIKENATEPIKTLSLFTGAGGLDIGFHDSWFRSKYMVEIENNYIKTLEANCTKGKYLENSKAVCIDIRSYYPEENLEIDFIIGGPPCQTFSAAGRRAAGVLGTTDPRGMLFEEYVRLLKKLQPKAFLFENVYGITGAQNGEAWKRIKEGFKSAGYNIFYRILDTADYGVPQHRERLIIVGLREGKFLFPYPTHGPDSISKRPHYSAGEAVAKLQNTEPLKKVNGKFGYLLNDIPPGLNYSFYTEKMGHFNPVFSWRSKFSDFLYKADPEKPVRAIKAQGGQYTGPLSWENRYFTVAELKRLQTIPDDYELIGKRQVAIEQIGNSVPTQMARILALAILDQVFHIGLPFKIEYMSPEKELSFRMYKRLQTEEYEKKAKEAINNMIAKGRNKLNGKNHDNDKHRRYLTANLKWSNKQSTESFNVYIKHQFKTDEWLVMGNTNANFSKGQFYSITIRPNDSSTWPLPYKKVILVAFSDDELVFTSLWKAFEEKLPDISSSADLVQLFGYYQYKPKIICSMEFNKNFKNNLLWSVIKLIVAGMGVSKQLAVKQFEMIYGINEEHMLTLFKKLRVLGYEIRNQNTNPQIREGEYLIPYAFPTLTNRSVQLRKRL